MTVPSQQETLREAHIGCIGLIELLDSQLIDKDLALKAQRLADAILHCIVLEE